MLLQDVVFLVVSIRWFGKIWKGASVRKCERGGLRCILGRDRLHRYFLYDEEAVTPQLQ